MHLFSHQAEQAVIGGLILDNDAWHKVQLIKTEDFHHPQHRVIFQAIKKLAVANQPFDIVTLSEALERDNRLDQAGGMAYVGALAKDTPSAKNIGSYAAIVKDKANKRKVVDYLKQGIESVPGTDSLETLLSDIQARFESIKVSGAGESITFREAFDLTIEHIDNAAKTNGTVGVPTSLQAIDGRIGGLQSSRLIILAARPATGKTALANQIMRYAAKSGYPIGVLSLEMSPEELTARALASEYQVGVSGLLFGHDKTIEQLVKNMGKSSIQDLPIHMDTDTYTLSGIVARLTEWKRKYDIQLGIIDHIGLIHNNTKQNRNDWVGEVSRTLKVTAKRLQIPILALSQLNRNVEQNQRRPRLSDLRDSGNIEQDADVCIFLHTENNNAHPVILEIGLLKNRTGIGGVWLSERFEFDGKTQRITQVNLSPHQVHNPANYRANLTRRS